MVPPDYAGYFMTMAKPGHMMLDSGVQDPLD